MVKIKSAATITHSLIAIVAVSWLMWWVLNQADWDRGIAIPMVLGFVAGYLSHLLGDWLTNSGVPLLWPSKRRFVSPLKLCTGDFREYILGWLMYGWVAMTLVKML